MIDFLYSAPKTCQVFKTSVVLPPSGKISTGAHVWFYVFLHFYNRRRILWFCSLASNSLPRKVLQTSLEKDLIKFAIPIFPWGSPFSRSSFPLILLVFTQLSMHISIIMPLFATSVVPPQSEGNKMLLYRLKQWLNAKFRKILLYAYVTNAWNYFGKWVPSYLIFSIKHFSMVFDILTCTIKGQKKPTVL